MSKRFKFTLASADRKQEATFTTPMMQPDVDIEEMLRIIREDQVDPSSRVVMIRELKR